MAGYAGIQSDVAGDWMMPLGRVPGTKSRRSGSRFGSNGIVRYVQKLSLAWLRCWLFNVHPVARQAASALK